MGTIPINGISHGANATISLTLGGSNPDVDRYLRLDTENKTIILNQMVDRDVSINASGRLR